MASNLKMILYHPSYNGLAKKAVQIIKQGLKMTDVSLNDRLARLLFNYDRITPHSTTGVTPSKLYINGSPALIY